MPDSPVHTHFHDRTSSILTITAASILCVTILSIFTGVWLESATSAADVPTDRAHSAAFLYASRAMAVILYGLVVAYGLTRPMVQLHERGTSKLRRWAGALNVRAAYAREPDELNAYLDAGPRNHSESMSDRRHQIKTYSRRFSMAIKQGQDAALSIAMLIDALSEEMALSAARLSIDDATPKRDPALIVQAILRTYPRTRVLYSGPPGLPGMPHSVATDFMGLVTNLVANADTHGAPDTLIHVSVACDGNHITLTVANRTTDATQAPAQSGTGSARHGNDGDRDSIRRLNGTLEHHHDHSTYTVTATIPISPAANPNTPTSST